MPCLFPITGFRAKATNPSGKRSVVFSRDAGFADQPIEVPCGRCRGCRLEKSMTWSLRCIHEAKMHKENCFITLTFNPENEPHDGSIRKRHMQNFMKELRAAYPDKRIRFFGCGEYGEKPDKAYITKLGRPHYHIILFGHDFDDKQLFKQGDYPIYTSSKLDSLWRKGFTTVAACTQETAAYTARYVCKKITGELADEHYRRTCRITGETNQLEPEFILMSRGGRTADGKENLGGIGKRWFDKHRADTRKGYIRKGNKVFSVPKYYRKLMTETEEEIFVQNKKKPEPKKRREEKARQYTKNAALEIKNRRMKRTL